MGDRQVLEIGSDRSAREARRGHVEGGLRRPLLHGRDLIVAALCALVGLGIAATAHASTTALDVVFVLDNSGSMREHDPDRLTRVAVLDLAEALAADPDIEGRIAVVLFDGDARLAQPLTPVVDGAARTLLAGSLRALDFSGQRTNGSAGIERALYELRQGSRPDAQKAILFFTDGKIDTGSAESDLEANRWLREDLAEESLAEGIRIFGVALTEAADYQVMQALALKTGARYFRALEATELDGVVTEILALISDDLANDPLQASPPSLPIAAARASMELPPVAAAPAPSPDGRDIGLLGWLPVALLLVAGSSILWRRRRTPRDRAIPQAPNVASAEVTAPDAQLLDVGGQVGDAGTALPLRRGRTSIGRDPHNDIVLADDTISSEHAVIELRHGRYRIEDLRSTNGTRVGETRLEQGESVALKGGDHVRFAEIDLMFVMAGYVPAGATFFLQPGSLFPRSEESSPPNPAEPDTAEHRVDERSPVSQSPALPADPVESTQPRGLVSDDAPSPAPRSADRPAARLDDHLAQVEAISPAFGSFVERAFDPEMRSAISMAAAELIAESGASGHIERKTYTASRVRYLIYAVPASVESARMHFQETYGGFTRVLTEALQDESFRREGCEILAVLSFGQTGEPEDAPWVSLSVVPDEDQDPGIDLLSYELLTDEERHAIDPSTESGATSRMGLA